MTNIPATEFKAKCLELMDRVAERRETFIITKRGKPVAKLAPLDPKPKDSLFGCLRDKVRITGDIINPVLPPEAWEALKEWDEFIEPQQRNERAGKKSIQRSSRGRR